VAEFINLFPLLKGNFIPMVEGKKNSINYFETANKSNLPIRGKQQWLK